MDWATYSTASWASPSSAPSPPWVATSLVAGSGPAAPPPPPTQIPNPPLLTEDFMLKSFKIAMCPHEATLAHDWALCPYAHTGEKVTRRDPSSGVYTGISCCEAKKTGFCQRGDQCPYAHNVFEYWLHPTRYRTQLCNDGPSCARRICFFAHDPSEVRVPPCKPCVPPRALAGLAAEAAARGGGAPRPRGRARGRRGGGGAVAAAAAGLYGLSPGGGGFYGGFPFTPASADSSFGSSLGSTPCSSLDVAAAARSLSLASLASAGGVFGSLDGGHCHTTGASPPHAAAPGFTACATDPARRRSALDGRPADAPAPGTSPLWAEVAAAAAAARAAALARAYPPGRASADVPADAAAARRAELGVCDAPLARQWSVAATALDRADGGGAVATAAASAEDELRLASLRLRLELDKDGDGEAWGANPPAARPSSPPAAQPPPPVTHNDWAPSAPWALPDAAPLETARSLRAFLPRDGQAAAGGEEADDATHI